MCWLGPAGLPEARRPHDDVPRKERLGQTVAGAAAGDLHEPELAHRRHRPEVAEPTGRPWRELMTVPLGRHMTAGGADVDPVRADLTVTPRGVEMARTLIEPVGDLHMPVVTAGLLHDRHMAGVVVRARDLVVPGSDDTEDHDRHERDHQNPSRDSDLVQGLHLFRSIVSRVDSSPPAAGRDMRSGGHCLRRISNQACLLSRLM